MEKLKNVKCILFFEYDGVDELKKDIESLFKKYKIDFKFDGAEYGYIYYFISGYKNNIINFYVELYYNGFDKEFINKDWDKYYNKKDNIIKIIF